MLRSPYEIVVFHDGWRRLSSCRVPVLRALLCLMLALPAMSASARSPLSLPQEEVAQKKSAAANRPIEPEPERGQLLYENHCMSCHASVVHIRTRHSARSLEDIRIWTQHWAGELRLPWKAEEVDDVARFLDRRYYKFEEPEPPAK